jgi:hypothetical protein
MDILNWLGIKKQNLIRTTLDSPQDLLVLGADVSFQKRGDKYQSYAMPAKDFIEAGLIANTAHYELDITVTNTVTVNTIRGIIDITGMGTTAFLTPDPAYATSYPFLINNPDLDLSVGNIDNIYVQYSVYYRQAADDNAIPYLISAGASSGLGFNLYNANPAIADTANWTGALYVYYELYTINN